MNYQLYQYSLCSAIALMLFFCLYFFFAKTPEKEIFNNYLRSRRTMGVALLALSANYSVHLFCGIRFININAAILMNLSTYFLCYWLFSSALTSLLDRSYITPRRLRTHICLWIVFSTLSGTVLFLLPKGMIQNIGLLAMAVWLITYGIILARRLILTYKRAVQTLDETHSDDVAVYVHWMSVFTYWAAIFGVGCGLLTFLPDEYIYIWILSSIPFYIYLFYSYLNYLLFYEQIERTLEDEKETNSTDETIPEKDIPQYYEHIARNLENWIKMETYTQSGFTINDMAKALGTNRTYLSAYIKERYNLSFRDWVANLRIEYAKQMLKEHPDMNIKQISEASGFLSVSHFIKTFTEKEGYTPAKWRKQ